MSIDLTENQSRTKPASSRSSQKTLDCEVVVIGAGPYGLSAAAHLKAKGISVRVFGEPMEFWARKMPEGMLLRSPRVASNISDPNRAFTLEAYEAASARPANAPVPLDAFVEYGRWFRQQLGSDLDQTNIAAIRREQEWFAVTLKNGGEIRCHRVVVAAGIGPFKYKPKVFELLDPVLASHCYEGRSIRSFTGKRVAVIGAGQSALESAALLHEAGADVEIIARIPQLRWIGMHPWLHNLGPISTLLYSEHDVGPAGISRLVAMPRVVHRIPLKLRDRIRTRAVRPAGSKWLPERLKKVKVSTGRMVTDACAVGHEVKIRLDDGSERSIDHVLMGTGYSVDIRKYEFLSQDIVPKIQIFDGYPVLTSGFCSSVPGLHFIGATAARSFGPLLYFVAGTEFASRELTSHILRHRNRGR
ncbi:MAG: FAD-dependent oxidoreductase [Nitrospira sp.]